MVEGNLVIWQKYFFKNIFKIKYLLNSNCIKKNFYENRF